MKEKSLYQCHVFICTNERKLGAARECCAHKGAEELRQSLKQWASAKYGKKVRINSSGCLDFCEKGIAAVVYPQSEWHFLLNIENLETLKKSIEEKMGY